MSNKTIRTASLNSRSSFKEADKSMQKTFIHHLRLRSLNIDILCLQEVSAFLTQTHLSAEQQDQFHSFMFLYSSPLLSKQCTIIFLSLSLVLTNMSISLDERCIYASVCDLNYRLVCQVINVYALSQPADRLHFYDSFLSLPFVPEAPTDPFLVISDFNMDFYAIHDHYPLAFRLRFDWLQEHFANCFTERVPTFKSSDCCSCIDYMYGLLSIHSRLTDALNTFLPTAWTDHSLHTTNLLPSREDIGPEA